MINSIRTIGTILGKEVNDENDLLKYLVKREDNNQKKYIIIMNFDTKKKLVEFNIEEGSPDKLEHYLWIGNYPGNCKQINCITDNLNNMLMNTINDLIAYLDENSHLEANDIYKSAKRVFENFYFSYKDKEKKEKYYLDWKKIKNFEKRIEVYNANPNNKSKIHINQKELLEEKNKYNDNIIKAFGFNEKYEGKPIRYLYLLSIDNETFFDQQTYAVQYKKMLVYEKFKKNFSSNNKGKKYIKFAVCTVCGKPDQQNCTSKDYVFKFYIQDKPGFSSNFDGKFTKNFLICEDCYKKSLVGKNFITRQLKSRLWNLKFYIIPEFFREAKIDIYKVSEIIKKIYNPASNIKSLEEFNKHLKNYIKWNDCKNSFTINYLFYSPKNKNNPDALNIVKIFKDVKPFRLDTLFKTINDINQNTSITNLFGINFSLVDIYYIIPQKENTVSYSYLDCIEAAFKALTIHEKTQIKEFVKGMRILYYKEQTDAKGHAVYNLGKRYNKKDNSDYYLRYHIYKCNFFLFFMECIGCIKEYYMNNSSEELIILINSKIAALQKANNKKLQVIIDKFNRLKNYLESFKSIINSDQKIALIVMGYIMSDVAYKQYQAGLKNKPVLSKIKFSGMNIRDIIKFSNVLTEKLVQYKRIDYTELLLYIKDKLLIKHMDCWELTIDENVFYIMSGYAVGSVFIQRPDDMPVDIQDSADEEFDDESGDSDE